MNLVEIKNENGVNLVSARELHGFLEVGRDFTSWIKGRVEKYGFEENVDFTVVSSFHQNGGKGGRPQDDYILKLDMAKELSMVENNDKGRQARKYFIECEKKAITKLPATYKEALLALVEAEEEKERLECKIEEDKPKVEYYEELMESETLYETTLIAKELGLRSARRLNQFLHEIRVQYKLQGGSKWVLYAEFSGMGLSGDKTHLIKGKSFTTMAWTEKGRQFVKDAWNNHFGQ